MPNLTLCHSLPPGLVIDKIEDPNSKLKYTYIKALKVIKAYPLVLKNGNQAKKELSGVGDKIAGILNNLNCKGDGSPLDDDDQNPKASASTSAAASSSTIPKKRPAAPKKYIPSSRSGGYAILLALHRHAGPTGFLNKHDIQRHGDQYSNSSFTLPKAGSNFQYTAWNSMSKLLQEDLVAETGNPKRYTLTDEGLELAEKLSSAHDKRKSSHEEARKEVILDSHCTSDMLDEEELELEIQQPINEGFCSRQSSFTAPTAPSIIRSSRPWQGFDNRMFVNPPPSQKTTTTTATATVRQPATDLLNSGRPTDGASLVRSLTGASASSFKTATSSSSTNSLTFHNTFYAAKKAKDKERLERALQNYSGTLRKLSVGSFEIVLALDNREVRSRRERDFFQQQLEKKGVKVITIPLTLGDMCWVARSFHDHDDLIILEYIVERKAKEDLIMSITDGRFKEQKHRLSRCGVSNIIYLVEEYDPYAWVGDALATSLTETQIHHNFFVKQCINVADTVDYLANMTRFISLRVLPKPLCVLNAVDIQSDTFASLKIALEHEHKRPFHLPLTSFFHLTTKTKQLTKRDIWIKQLLTIRGVSSEKALVLANHFTCLGDFVCKLAVLGPEDRVKKIISCSDHSHQRRQFGKALASQILAVLFGDDL